MALELELCGHLDNVSESFSSGHQPEPSLMQIKLGNPKESPMNAITESDIMAMVEKYLELPFPQICRHSVALDLLSLLESKGYKLNTNLVAAISNADDDTALKLIQK